MSKTEYFIWQCDTSTDPVRKLTMRYETVTIDYIVFDIKMTELPIAKKY